MARAHVLAIDQGTTNTKVLLFDENAAVVASASVPVAIAFPQPGWVEQDALDLWRSVERGIEACLAGAPVVPDVIGVTNQRESALMWERATGRPLGPCITWQCRRTSAFCDELKRRGLRPTIEQKTGLTIDPLFSASKLHWLLEQVPNGRARAAAGELCAGTVDSWLLWNLTGGAVHACDATNAARTQLYGLERSGWDDDLLEVFGIPRPMLPEVRPSSGRFGVTRGVRSLPDGLVVAGLIGDSHGALFGQAGFLPGTVKATYGTGSSLMMTTAALARSTRGLSTTIAWALPDGVTFALEGNITMTGGAIDWLGQFLGGTHTAASVIELARTMADTGGVYVVPAFAGLGAPHWDDRARGLVCGLTRGSTAAHVARATLEAIAYQVRDVFEAMAADSGTRPPRLLADGGASRNDLLMQFQADMLGCPVVRHASADLSALGAAWLAGLAAGVWPSLDALAGLSMTTDTFEPSMAPDEREARYAGWVDAVERTRR